MGYPGFLHVFCLEILGSLLLLVIADLCCCVQVHGSPKFHVENGPWKLDYWYVVETDVNRTRWFGLSICMDKYVFGLHVIVRCTCPRCVQNTPIHTGLDYLITPLVNELVFMKIRGTTRINNKGILLQ